MLLDSHADGRALPSTLGATSRSMAQLPAPARPRHDERSRSRDRMTPLSTYRLQLNRDFDLPAATRLVPYLRALGVDWMYLSPIFAAQTRKRARLRRHRSDDREPRARRPRRARRAVATRPRGGLRILIDIVPNHQAATDENRRWQEALESRTPGWFDVWWVGDQPKYRRFFDVDGLVGVRVEDEAVFRESHALVFELLEHGVVDGLRVDHVDGLADPGQYLERLHGRDRRRVHRRREDPGARRDRCPDWPVAGTTGYEAGDALDRALDRSRRSRTARARPPRGERRGAVRRGRARQQGVRARRAVPARVDTAARAARRRSPIAPALRAVTLGLDVYRIYGDSPEDDTPGLRAWVSARRRCGGAAP